MRKRISWLMALIAIILSIIVQIPVTAFADTSTVYLGGFPAGFTMSTKGAYVVGLCDVITDNGLTSPAKDAGIKVGDVILTIENTEINCAKDIELSVKDTECKTIVYKRNGELVKTQITPSKDMYGNIKIGVFIKDAISGIGTVTFIKGDKFASLGHAVIDDQNNVLDITNGQLFSCNITGIVKGERGCAGELKGVFLRTNAIAEIDKNLSSGVYGRITKDLDLTKLREIEVGEAKVGNAVIYSTVNGKVAKEYEISIVKNDHFGENKNFIIKITDEELLESTGGIVQGMSGSPIVQNGKLVGAVTHVFINDPTRGFGISIDNMLKNI